MAIGAALALAGAVLTAFIHINVGRFAEEHGWDKLLIRLVAILSTGVRRMIEGWTAIRKQWWVWLFLGISIGVSVGVHDQADAKRQAIRRFEVESEAFGGFVAVFVLDVARDNKANQQAFERLATNLASQKAALDDLLPRLPPILHTEAIEYEKALLAFNAAMAKVSDVESMREFWERNSDLQVARRNLLPQLIILDG